MKPSDIGTAFIVFTSLPMIGQQAIVRIGLVDLKLGMTKQEVFRQFPKVLTTEKRLASAEEIPDGEMVIVCSNPTDSSCDGGQIEFRNSRLSYVSKVVVHRHLRPRGHC